MALLDELVELPLGQDRTRQVEATVFPLHGLVEFEFVNQPIVRLARVLKLGRAERVGDALEAVAETVCKIVGRVDLPFCSRAEMIVVLEDAIRGQIPHLGVGVVNVLFHAKRRFFGLVFAVTHGAEFGE